MDRTAIVEGLNILIQADNYVPLIREITNIIERWDTHPMAYEGNLKPLNALIEVGLESREAFENLLSLAEQKRKLLPVMRRVDYQRNLMRERRARIAKALELQELTTSKSFKSAKDRDKATREIMQRWGEARKKFIAAKGKLSWKERNVATTAFWETIDTQLDDNLKAARKKH